MDDFLFDEDNITREYLIVTNRAEIKQKLIELGRDNCFLLKDNIPDEKELSVIIKDGRTKSFFLMYFESAEQHKAFKDLISEKCSGRYDILSNVYQLPYPQFEEYKDTYGEWPEGDLLPSVIELSRFLEIIEAVVVTFDNFADSRGWILHHGYENRCGNCHELLGSEDKYCTFCGTKRGEGEYKPYSNPMNALYGCPSIYKWKCPGCGNVWVAASMSPKRHCMKCGEEGKIVKEERLNSMIDWFDMTSEEMELRKKRMLEDDEGM